MSTAIPEFNHVAEYARYGWVLPGLLQKRVAPFYSGALEVIVADDDSEAFNTVSSYKTKLRGYLYHHWFYMEWLGVKWALKARHVLSADALKRLSSIISNDAGYILELYSILVHFMNHDMLHGFNGVGENFREFDEQLIFGGVEFFPLMTHSEVFERWMKRNSNGDFVLDLGRAYIKALSPLVIEYGKAKDPEILRLLDYFILIYQKCLLTFIPLSTEIVGKFNGRARNILYPDFPQCELTRSKCDSLLITGLEKGWIKNNHTLLSKPGYDRRQTGAAKAWSTFLDGIFWEGKTVIQIDHTVKLTIENLIMWWCFRMVPNMPRPANLQRRFQRIYMKK